MTAVLDHDEQRDDNDVSATAEATAGISRESQRELFVRSHKQSSLYSLFVCVQEKQ